ncbi:MAG: endolytic transglycosylase MltG [Patescibacteria group bacterium]|nr:endolytic transglycosylase MltG [Patescibacteria group bacterium]
MKRKILSWPTRFLIFISVVGFSLLLAAVWWRDGISPVNKNDTTPVVFVVRKGESVQSIINRLSSERLIRSRLAFFLLVKVKKADGQIQAGDFRLQRSMSSEEILEELRHGAIDVWITILEGWRVEEIAQKLAQELKIPEREFLSFAREGYMFPDTYLIPKDASAAAIVSIFQKNFDRRVTAEMREQASRPGLNFEDVVILASLVEREGRTKEDKQIIAGILLNRLKKGMKLDVDATLQYASGYDPQEKTWWKKRLTNEDKKMDSPYNTYKYAGLPPGPICNPGLISIQAVLQPKITDYYFYLHDPQGNAHYARTLEEHERNIQKYLR